MQGRMAYLGLTLLTVLALLLASAPAYAADVAPAGSQGQGMAKPDFAEGRILVKFKPGVSRAGEDDAHERAKGRVEGEIPGLGVKVVAVAKGSEGDKVAAYSRDSRVEYAEPDFMRQVDDTPNDTHYLSNQWGLPRIKAPAAWSVTHSNSSIKIAVLDTGVDLSHPDLAGKLVLSLDCTNGSADCSGASLDDGFGHGTHVAGIAAATTNNELGVAGLGWDASIMSVKVCNDSGSCADSWISNGLRVAADEGVKVINMSLGGPTGSRTLSNAVSYAWNKGVVMAASAGNSGSGTKNYPAAYDKVIAVAATNSNDQKASWSNFGKKWVDVAAPGVSIYSTMPDHPNAIGLYNYGYLSGTSMASPFVAGLAALVWGTSYGTSNTSVRSRIETTADRISGTNNYWYWGRINACKAVGGIC